MVPPAANGTTKRTGRAGQVGARLARQQRQAAEAAAAPSMMARRFGRDGTALRKDMATFSRDDRFLESAL